MQLTTAGPNGGLALTPPPATIMSRLTDAQQDAVTAQVNGAIEGRTPRTDLQTWYAIRQGLTGDDATERRRWASKNLVQFMGRLSAEDFAALEKLQAAVRRNDGGAEQNRLQIITSMANNALRSAGIDLTPRPDAAPDSDAAQAARFHRALQDELSAFESKGRKPTEAEAYDIVNGLKNTAVRRGWLRVGDQYGALPDDVKLVFQPTPEEVTEASSEEQPRPVLRADTPGQLTSDGSERWESPNIVPVAGDDKKKDSERIRLPGSDGRGPLRDNEMPPPKQINPLALPGGGGGGLRLPGLSRPWPSAGEAPPKPMQPAPTQPAPPSSGGARKAPAGGRDSLSKQDDAIEADAERSSPGTPQLQKGGRVFVEPHT